MSKRIAMAAAMAFLLASLGCSGGLPEREMPDSIVQAAGQNWTEQQRTWFHHTSQGTKLMPYAWFLSLEQPVLNLPFAAPAFASPDHMARFGFLPSPRSAFNPDGLPISDSNDRSAIGVVSVPARR